MSTNEYDKPCVRNQDLIMRNEALTEDVRVSLNTIVKLKSTIEKLEQDIREFESDPIVESLRFKIVRLEVELATAKSKKQTYGETINQRWEDDIRNEMGNLNYEILSLRDKIRKMDCNKKLEDEKNNDKLHAIDSLRHENDAMKKTIVDLHAQILDTTKSADYMSDKITSLQHVNNNLKDRINFLQKENDGLKLKVGQVFDINAIELEDLKSKCRDLGRRNENLFHNIRVYQKDWFRLADLLNKCNAEIKAQSDTIKALEGKALEYELGFQAQPEYRELLCLRSCAESIDSDMKRK